MAVKRFNTRIQLKNDTTANWSSQNGSALVLLKGELAWDSDLKNFKIGDSTSAYSALPYVIGASVLADWSTNGSASGNIDASDSLALALHKLENKVNAATTGGITGIRMNDSAVTVTDNVADLGNQVTTFGGASGVITIGDHLSMDGQQLKTDATGSGTLATKGDITAAIEALDVTAITGTAGQTITSISETDGVISATYSNIYITSSQINDLTSTYASGGTAAITGAGVAAALATLTGSHDISTASAIENPAAGEATYKLELFDATQTAGIVSTNGSASDTLYFSQAYSAANPILTKADIGSLSGAMHFKQVVNSDSALPSSGQVSGDVYIVGTAGTYAGQDCEVGDMIIWNGSAWNIVTGENQVTPVQGGAELVAGAAATTIGTVDGVALTAKTTINAGNATIASVADGVVTLRAGVTQGTGTGTIANSTASDITLAKVATTGSANDITVTEAVYGNGSATSNAQTALTNLSSAIASVNTLIEGLDATVDADETASTSPVTQSTPNADFNVLNSVTEANGKLTGGTAYTLKKLAATGAAADVALTDTGNNYTSDNVEGALSEIPTWDLILDCGTATTVTHTSGN